MTIEPASDGWFIDRNGRYYHVNQAWLDDMFRHQVKPYGNNPAFNQLNYAFSQGVSAVEFGRLFEDFIDHRGPSEPPADAAPPVAATPEAAFREFIGEQKRRGDGTRG